MAAPTDQSRAAAVGPHARAAPEVCAALGVDARAGLSETEAARRVGEQGPNRLRTEPAPSRLALVARQFGNSMVLLLIAAAAISISIGELLDAGVIFAIVVANAIFGAVQEGRADQAAAAVRALLAPTAHVLRDGHLRERPAEVVVSGDVVALGAGDRIPADGRLVDSALLQVDESALTGESLARGKRAAPSDPADAPLAERHTTVLAGTTVTRGTGRFVVTATGARTEMGRIAGAAGKRRARTPLQARLDRLTRALIPMAAGIVATLALLSYLQGDTLAHSVLVGVSLAVAALPEGLPAVVTITLALSMRQMAERGAIVRRLAAVETLGSTTVICSDKTGTLTENRLAVQRLWAVPGCEEADLLEAAVLASSEGEQADPLEQAIIAAAGDHGITRETALAGGSVVGARPFDSERKRMSVVIAAAGGRRSARVKGAPEVLIPLLRTPDAAGEIERVVTGWAERGLRVLLVARRPELEGGEDPERGLEALGLLGLADTPRATARDSVAEARAAGVRTIMITGDHPRTAASVAAATGVAAGEGPPEVVTGPQLDALSPDGLRDAVRRVSVFARVVPEHKVRIIDALKRDGEIAAMTGDGVNDVPALKAAHIGVAMGRRGTDAASEAADMVLTDDDYSTIVRAIRQGRAIHDNIVRFVHFLFAGNAGEVLAFALAVVLGSARRSRCCRSSWSTCCSTACPPPRSASTRPGAGSWAVRPGRRPKGCSIASASACSSAARRSARRSSPRSRSGPSRATWRARPWPSRRSSSAACCSCSPSGAMARSGRPGATCASTAPWRCRPPSRSRCSSCRRSASASARPVSPPANGSPRSRSRPSRSSCRSCGRPARGGSRRPRRLPASARRMPLGAAHEHRDGPPEETVTVDPTEQAGLLLRDLHTDVHGLLQREADRRLVRFGRNELVRRGGRRRPRQLGRDEHAGGRGQQDHTAP